MASAVDLFSEAYVTASVPKYSPGKGRITHRTVEFEDYNEPRYETPDADRNTLVPGLAGFEGAWISQKTRADLPAQCKLHEGDYALILTTPVQIPLSDGHPEDQMAFLEAYRPDVFDNPINFVGEGIPGAEEWNDVFSGLSRSQLAPDEEEEMEGVEYVEEPIEEPILDFIDVIEQRVSAIISERCPLCLEHISCQPYRLAQQLLNGKYPHVLWQNPES